MTRVKAAPFVPAELVDRFEAAGAAAGFRVERFGRAAVAPLLALTRRTPGPRPRVYLSAGIHGDEPAPPLALLALLEAGWFGSDATWFLCPLLNPDGFARATRENPAGIDLNRDYRARQSAEVTAHVRWLQRQPNFDLALCLHEDWESTGFYLYELNPHGRPTLAEGMVAAAGTVMPIESSAVIDGRPAQGGILRPEFDLVGRELWPEALYLQAHHTTLSYTLETPSSLPLPQRIAAMQAAVTSGLERSFHAHSLPAKLP